MRVVNENIRSWVDMEGTLSFESVEVAGWHDVMCLGMLKVCTFCLFMQKNWVMDVMPSFS